MEGKKERQVDVSQLYTLYSVIPAKEDNFHVIPGQHLCDACDLFSKAFYNISAFFRYQRGTVN